MRRPRLMSPMDISKMKRRKTQGQIKNTRRAVMPKARIGSLIGTAKSSRKVKGKMDPLVITEHHDVHATVSQGQVGYWGYSDAGSLDQQLEMGVRALVNMFARRAGLKPSNIEQDFSDSYLQDNLPTSKINLARIVIAFQGLATDGDISREETVYAVTETSSIESLTTTIMADIKAKATFSAPFKPVRAIIQSQDIGVYSGSVGQPGSYYRTFATYDLENVMIDFSYMRKYKWQNVTPAESGADTSNINDIHANPLSGKIYQFKHRVPQVRAAMLDDSNQPMLSTIQDSELADGALDTTAFRTGIPGSAGNFGNSLTGAFAQPFKGMQIFKDTISEDKVYMPPGGYKQLIRKGNKTMNFTRFCAATVLTNATTGDYVRRSAGESVPDRIGTSTIWGLEPVIRTDVNELVKIATQMETWYTCKARAGTKTVPVVQINRVATGVDFGS